MSAPIVLTVRRSFAVSPERVFDAWLDPEQAAQFLFATPDGDMLLCEIDARVGGEGVIAERRKAGTATHRLRFEAIDRPRKLVFLFGVEPAPESEWTRVTIEIVPAEAGCTLTLTHEMDPDWADHADRTRHGWSMIVDSLARVLETDDD